MGIHVRTAAVAALLLLVGAAAPAAAQDGRFEDSCRNIQYFPPFWPGGELMTAHCQDRFGRWRFTVLRNYSHCLDIANDNGLLVCLQWSWGPPGPGRDVVPAGSYQQSCDDIYVEGNTLHATCQTRRGRWVQTSLAFRQCRGDIANDNGTLVCAGPGRGAGVPPGSYQQSCTDAYVQGDTLFATCQTRRGSWRATSLAFRRCRGDIANDNGALVCVAVAPPPGPRNSVTLFQDSRFRGPSVEILRDTPNLGAIGFNDTASSLAISGGGTWQFCEHANYRGRCVTLDANVRNLDGSGLNDRVSSVRRLR